MSTNASNKVRTKKSIAVQEQLPSYSESTSFGEPTNFSAPSDTPLYEAHMELPKCEVPSDVDDLPSYDEVVMQPPVGLQGQEILNIFQGSQQIFAEQWSKIYYDCLANPIACARDMTKDRYPGNQFTYAHSRVKLDGGGYINANYILNGQYIAAQAPLENTIGDFWNMIWRDRVTIIVMLTKLKEGGKLKAHRYWPTSNKPNLRDVSVVVNGDDQINFKIEPLHKESLPLETITNSDGTPQKKCIFSRTYNLRKTQNGEMSEDRTITQIQYTGWPDHGCPDDLETFVKLLVHVHNLYEQLPQPAPPLVVHCSAGIGRTGTFLTLFYQLRKAGKQFQKQHSFNQTETDSSRAHSIREFLRTYYFAISETIMKLREDRSSMVQSDSQHYFCFQVIHAILHPDTSDTLLKLLFPVFYKDSM